MSARIPGVPDPVARAASIKRSNDEMRARIAELKAQLENDRARTRELHREKVLHLLSRGDGKEGKKDRKRKRKRKSEKLLF